MKLGFGLYSNMLDDANLTFARQAGATHIVAHLTDYFHRRPDAGGVDQPTGTVAGWGFAKERAPWPLEVLRQLRADVERNGLTLEAIENLSPGFWHDVLLDGPRRAEQLEMVKQFIRDLGRAGIPILGYNFSIAGVAGRERGPWARGGAEAVGQEGPSEHLSAPIPNGMVWNMTYDASPRPGTLPSITHDELWRRYRAFLQEVLPVAEEAGVRLAAHPDDPPLETVRRQPRLVWQPRYFREQMAISDSLCHAVELCLGTVAEMSEGDLYETLDWLTAEGRVGYIHLRNVRGKVPYYKETFVDDGEIDMPRVFAILRKNRFAGVVIPDHAPQMQCAAPWHAGMAFAMGYLKALMQVHA